MTDTRIEVDFTGWRRVGDLTVAELSREYIFKNLRGPGTITKIILCCRILFDETLNQIFSLEEPKQKRRYLIYVAVSPPIFGESYFVAQFAPSDDLIHYKFVTVKVTATAEFSSIVFDIEDGERLFDVLLLGKQITMRLMT